MVKYIHRYMYNVHQQQHLKIKKEKQNHAEDCCRPDNCLLSVFMCVRVCLIQIESIIWLWFIQRSQSIVNIPCEFNSQYKHILSPSPPPVWAEHIHFNRIAYICYLKILYKSYNDWYFDIVDRVILVALCFCYAIFIHL